MPHLVMWSELFPSLPFSLSTPLQRHLIMKTLTHLHGYVWSKLHSKPHQIRIICECKTLFFPRLPHLHNHPAPHSVFLQRALQGTCSNEERIYSFLTFSGDLSLVPPCLTVRDRESPTIIPGSDLHPHPSHAQIRPSLLWLIRHTGSTLITICQWLVRANCRRLLCIHVLKCTSSFCAPPSHSSLGCLFYSIINSCIVSSNILKLQQWFADVTVNNSRGLKLLCTAFCHTKNYY